MDFFFFKIEGFIIFSDADNRMYHYLRQYYHTQKAQIVFGETGHI